jgi:hypothetical protein
LVDLMARTTQPNRVAATHVPAPVGGINAADPAGALPVTDAIRCNNMIAGEFGLQTRLGYQEHCTGLLVGVRSVIPFHGADSDNDKLFASTNGAIFDVTTSSAVPASVFALPVTSGNAGYMVSTMYTTSAGHFLFAADEVNGLLRYDETTGTWAAAADITGVDVADIAFVMSWKNRLWFVMRDRGTAYYLPVGQISGAATAFEFGNKFRAGGTLVGLWSWTADGGTGIDDFLVAVSSAGDVLVYQGTDPDSAIDFSMRGSWFVGAPPVGRRIATEFGGELLLLTRQGILPMSRLLSGQPLNPAIYSTRKIASQFSAEMAINADVWGWSMRMHSSDQALVVTIPDLGALFTDQFAMSLNTGGWATFSGVPMQCADEWRGEFYFGSPRGVVYKMTGARDNVDRAGNQSPAYGTTTDIVAEGITSFQQYGSPLRKTVVTIRPHMMAGGAMADYAVQARYDFDRSEVSLAPFGGGVIGAAWDVALWDVGLWGSDDLMPFGRVRGASGIGANVAIAWSIKANTRTTLVGFDVSWRQAGLM